MMKKSNYTVILIDDNAIFRMIFETTIKNIKNFNIDLISYENALDALEGLSARSMHDLKMPDFLFVDINMPYMSGWEMMDKILEENLPFIQNCKTFIMSSSHLASDFQKIHQYPFLTDYIQKPFDKERLAEILTDF